jgi:hypothetical protein
MRNDGGTCQDSGPLPLAWAGVARRCPPNVPKPVGVRAIRNAAQISPRDRCMCMRLGLECPFTWGICRVGRSDIGGQIGLRAFGLSYVTDVAASGVMGWSPSLRWSPCASELIRWSGALYEAVNRGQSGYDTRQHGLEGTGVGIVRNTARRR